MKVFLSWSSYARLVSGATLLLSVSLPALATPPSQPGQPFGSVTGNTISLAWLASSDNVGVAGYNVYRNGSYETTVNDTRYTGTIDASQTNQFYVVAFDIHASNEGRNYSSRSAVQTFSAATDPVPVNNSVPTVPSSLNALRTSPSTVSLTWSASSDDQGVDGYNVYRDNQYVTTVTNPRLNDIQLAPGVEYSYYVVAFDEQRNFSARSAEASTVGGDVLPPVDPDPDPEPPVVEPPVTPDTQRPDTITGLSGVFANGSVSLEWPVGTDNVGVDGYNLYRDGSYLTTIFSNSYVDTAPPAARFANYAVAAFDEARNFGVTSPTTRIALTNTTDPVDPVDPIDPVDPEDPIDEDNGTPPTLREPFADAVPSPPFGDPFGSLLEIDNEVAVAGGPPTQPKNLRAELISNDWAEINWAPANDDVEVVEYRIYRSDGVTYTVRGDQTSPNSAAQGELDRFWNATIFIDCNYTRFRDTVHNCGVNGPSAGDEFIYEVSAIDDEGQESARSEPLEIIYHLAENAPIPYYDDFYKLPGDKFVQEHDLSRTRYFIDEFETVFVDEFDGTSVNESYWTTGLVWGDTRIINGEQQYFVNTQRNADFGYDPFKFTGDTMIIESIATPDGLSDKLPSVCDEADPTGLERCAFLSGALSSHDKFGLTYGYVESRMKVGGASGSLSSFYLYNRYPGTGRNLHSPEIDIIEYLGENPFGDESAFQTYHYANVNDGSTNSAPTMAYDNPDGSKYSDDFHTFGVLWEPQLVIWYIDGVEVKRMSGVQVARQRMNIVTYLVSGSAWAPTPDVDADIFPLQFEIDYIKAYQRPPYDTNGLYPD